MNGLLMLGLWTGVAAAIALIAGWQHVVCWTNANSGLAGWVQAVGSILAILATAWAVDHAHRLQKREADRKDYLSYTRFLETLFQLLGSARQIARKIVDLESGPGSSPDDRRTMLAELAALSDALRRMDLNRLDRFDYVESWLVGDALVRKLLDAVAVVDMPDRIPVVERANLEFLSGIIVETLDVRGKRIYKAIEERGGPPNADPLPSDWTKRPHAAALA